MKKIIIALAFIVMVTPCLTVYGGGPSVGATYNARTGDSSFDTALGDLNIQTTGKSLDEFISNLSISYNVPRIRIEDLLNKEKMTPADVYMTAGLARIINSPIDVVLKEYRANKGKGWGVIAKRLGIKPGSKEFHSLKNGSLTILGKDKQKDKIKNKKKTKKKNKKSRNK